MGLKDRFAALTKRAEDTAATHREQVDQAVEKAEAAAEQRTGGQYHDQIQKAAAKVEEMVERLPEPQPGQPSQRGEAGGASPSAG